MSDALDALERRIDELRARVRRAVRARDGALARSLRVELRRAERAWDDAIRTGGAAPAIDRPGSTVTAGAGEPGYGEGRSCQPSVPLPVRERAHRALVMLGVPASTRMIVTVHRAFFPGDLRGAQLTGLRTAEERSFRAAPFARPYYLCAALTERLTAARGLLAVSTWPLEHRVVGPLSPRVDLLVATERIAEHVRRLAGGAEGLAGVPPRALRLLVRMARTIPGALAEPPAPDAPALSGPLGSAPDRVAVDPATVIRAARAELETHARADSAARAATAARAGRLLSDAERLFGSVTLSDHMRRGV